MYRTEASLDYKDQTLNLVNDCQSKELPYKVVKHQRTNKIGL